MSAAQSAKLAPRRSQDPEPASGTPTLRDAPVDIPLKEKSEKNSDSEAGPDEDVEEVLEDGTTSRTGSVKDVLIVDWDGPNDPENPKK